MIVNHKFIKNLGIFFLRFRDFKIDILLGLLDGLLDKVLKARILSSNVVFDLDFRLFNLFVDVISNLDFRDDIKNIIS